MGEEIMPDHIPDMATFLSEFADQADGFIREPEINPVLRDKLHGIVNQIDLLRGELHDWMARRVCSVCGHPMGKEETGDETPEERVCDTCVRQARTK
jgi:hypothetical protein